MSCFEEKLVDTVRKGTMGDGADVVIDTVGGTIFSQALDWSAFIFLTLILYYAFQKNT